MNDVYIYSVPLPMQVKGVTVQTPDCCIIFVNDYLSEREKRKAIRHELEHYEHDHVYDLRSVGYVEKDAVI